MTQKSELSFATVNSDDPVAIAEWRAQLECKADERAKAAFERLKLLRIIDEHGESIGDELPADMRPGAQRDFGG